MKILVIADNPTVRQYLTLMLERESYTVDCATNKKEGLSLIETTDYSLILIDDLAHSVHRLELCSEIRTGRSKEIPAIIILSTDTTIEEKIRLLDGGADDYIAKPFSDTELLSRIRAVTRRTTNVQHHTLLTAKTIALDYHSGSVHRGTQKITLTPKEFELLALFLSHKGQVVSRGLILDRLWNHEHTASSKKVDTHILNLRKKIETKNQKFIVNVSGRGYKIDA